MANRGRFSADCIGVQSRALDALVDLVATGECEHPLDVRLGAHAVYVLEAAGVVAATGERQLVGRTVVSRPLTK